MRRGVDHPNYRSAWWGGGGGGRGGVKVDLEGELKDANCVVLEHAGSEPHTYVYIYIEIRAVYINTNK